MNEKRTPQKVVKVSRLCLAPDPHDIEQGRCGGEMLVRLEETKVWPTPSPERHWHVCTLCRRVEPYDRAYPYFTYEDA